VRGKAPGAGNAEGRAVKRVCKTLLAALAARISVGNGQAFGSRSAGSLLACLRLDGEGVLESGEVPKGSFTGGLLLGGELRNKFGFEPLKVRLGLSISWALEGVESGVIVVVRILLCSLTNFLHEGVAVGVDMSGDDGCEDDGGIVEGPLFEMQDHRLVKTRGPLTTGKNG